MSVRSNNHVYSSKLSTQRSKTGCTAFEMSPFVLILSLPLGETEMHG